MFQYGELIRAEAEADSAYHAPSSSYGAPSYNPPSYKDDTTHTHHHYHHYEAPKTSYKPSYKPPTYQAPAPSYNAPTYHAPPPSYHAPQPHYDSYGYAPYHGKNFKEWNEIFWYYVLWTFLGHTYYDDEEYIHLNKKDVTRGALLFGAGLLKGVIVTGLINNANNGITIGKKR